MGKKSKIEKLPKALRDELGERYLDGADFPEIAEWINNEPEAVKRWTLHFPDKPFLTADNFSCWKRDGGFAAWKEEWATHQLADRCMRIANASGGNITRGAAAILGGQILAGIEALADDPDPIGGDEDSDQDKPSKEDRLVKLAMALKMGAEAEAIPLKTQLAQGKAKLDTEKLALEKKKFRRTTCELFLEYFEDQRAKEIAANPSTPKDRKLDLLADIFFGEEPEGMGPDLDT